MQQSKRKSTRSISSTRQPLHTIPSVLHLLAIGLLGGLLLLGSVVHAGNKPKDGDEPENLHIAGYIERVTIHPENITFKARMDTGATTSSLNALNQERFERDGAEWIRFDVIDPENEDRLITLEREVVRNVRIVRHSGNHQRRAVVRMGFCIGSHYREEEVSLVDRSSFTYQMLVGRNHMRGAILVDSSRRYLQKPQCPQIDN